MILGKICDKINNTMLRQQCESNEVAITKLWPVESLWTELIKHVLARKPINLNENWVMSKNSCIMRSLWMLVPQVLFKFKRVEGNSIKSKYYKHINVYKLLSHKKNRHSKIDYFEMTFSGVIKTLVWMLLASIYLNLALQLYIWTF